MSNVQAKPRRSKGDGTIFKNSKDKWAARYSRKDYPTKEFTGSSKAEVKSKLDNWKFLVQSGDAITQTIKVSEYAEKFLLHISLQVKRGKLKQSSFDRIERTYQTHITTTFIVDILMCNLKSSDIQKVIDDMQEDYSFSTINKVFLFLHSIIRYGKDNKDFPTHYDPFTTVELPNATQIGVKSKEIEIIPNEYIERFKETALRRESDGFFSYRYGPALIFALNTGIRKSELLALSKNNIIVDENGRKYVHITETISLVKDRAANATTNYTSDCYLTKVSPKFPQNTPKCRSNRMFKLHVGFL